MKEQFVTYDIALKLKELGFDEDCLGYFNNDKILKNILNPKDCNNTFLKGLNLLSAPLWQQVIDWLRKKFYIQIIEQPLGFSDASMNPEFTVKEQGKLAQFKNLSKEQAILKAIELCQNLV